MGYHGDQSMMGAEPIQYNPDGNFNTRNLVFYHSEVAIVHFLLRYFTLH